MGKTSLDILSKRCAVIPCLIEVCLSLSNQEFSSCVELWRETSELSTVCGPLLGACMLNIISRFWKKTLMLRHLRCCDRSNLNSFWLFVNATSNSILSLCMRKKRWLIWTTSWASESSPSQQEKTTWNAHLIFLRSGVGGVGMITLIWAHITDWITGWLRFATAFEVEIILIATKTGACIGEVQPLELVVGITTVNFDRSTCPLFLSFRFLAECCESE